LLPVPSISVPLVIMRSNMGRKAEIGKAES
jgi:hypothetical protein